MKDNQARVRRDVGEIGMQETTLGRPRNEIEYLQEENQKLQATIQEQKDELLSLYRQARRFD